MVDLHMDRWPAQSHIFLPERWSVLPELYCSRLSLSLSTSCLSTGTISPSPQGQWRERRNPSQLSPLGIDHTHRAITPDPGFICAGIFLLFSLLKRVRWLTAGCCNIMAMAHLTLRIVTTLTLLLMPECAYKVQNPLSPSTRTPPKTL